MPPDQLPDLIPDSEFVPDRVPAAAAGTAVPPGADLIPNSDFVPDSEKYGGIGNTAKALAEGAAETATLGLSGAFEKGLGVKPEDVRGRAEAHPIAHGLGEVAGAVAPALLGDEAGALNVLGKVGSVGERTAKALVPGTEERLAARLAGWAGRGSAESAMLTGEHVLNEHMLGDPEATAQHALAEIGLSAVLGGAGGALIGGAAEGAMSAGRKLLDKEGGLLNNLTKLKSNAPEIEEAASRLGVEPLPGQVSASKTVQDLQSQITKEPTILGRKEQAAVDHQFEKIREAVTSAVGDSSAMTKAEVNDVLREGIEGAVDEVYKPLREGFAALKEKNVQFPVDAEELSVAQKKIREIEGAHKRPGSPEGSFTRRISDQLPLQETIDDVRKLRTSAGKEAFKPTDSALWHYGTVVGDTLDQLEEKSVTAGLAKALAAGQMTQDEVRNFVFLDAATKKGYRELKQNLEKLARSMGKSKVGGVEHFLGILSDKAEAGTLARSLFTKDSVKFLGFLKDKFPEQARILAQYQKGIIAEKAFQDGVVRPGAVLREVDKLEPEVRRFLFSEQDLQRLGDAQTLMEAMPKDINPSGTAKSVAWNEALNPFKHGGEAAMGAIAGGAPGALLGYAAGVAGPEISSLLKKGILHGLTSAAPEEAVRHLALGKIAEAAQRTAKYVSRAARAVFTRDAAERLTLSRDEHEKAGKKIAELSQDPQKLTARLAKITAGMDEHAPMTAAGISSATGRLVDLLSTKQPKPLQVSPFAPPATPSELQKGEFKRYVEAALDPVGVMSRVADGSLLAQDLSVLQTGYPALYASMRQAVTQEMSEAIRKGEQVPYATRLGISLFLGQPVDQTISPQSIVAVQATFQANSARQQPPGQGGGGTGPGPHSTKALAKVGQQSATPEQAAATRRISA